MHKSEGYGGRRHCTSVKIEMTLWIQHSIRPRAHTRTDTVILTMLSDAHHLGAAHTPVGASGTQYPVATEQKECHLGAIFSLNIQFLILSQQRKRSSTLC